MPEIVRSAGGVVLNAKGQVLVVNQNRNSWSLPKGHLDAGEDELTAAKREIYEESGISELELVTELGTYDRSRIGLTGGDDTSEIKRITLFLFRTRQEKLSPQDPRNPEARWLSFEDAAKILTHPKDRDFFLSTLPKVRSASAGTGRI